MAYINKYIYIYGGIMYTLEIRVHSTEYTFRFQSGFTCAVSELILLN